MAVVWATPDDLRFSTHPDAEYAIEIASWILYKLTAEKYPGVETVSEWYGYESQTCQSNCTDAAFMTLNGNSRSHIHHYFSYNTPFAHQLRLRHSPIVSINSVTIGTTVLPASQYRVSNSTYLTRAGSCGWDFEQGIEVEYTHGIMPPSAGKNAAAKLADEFILSFTGSDECRLPDRVTSVNRQGVSYTIMDPQEYIKDGRVGIYEVDLFIQAANPAGAHRRPRIFSASTPRGAQRF